MRTKLTKLSNLTKFIKATKLTKQVHEQFQHQCGLRRVKLHLSLFSYTPPVHACHPR